MAFAIDDPNKQLQDPNATNGQAQAGQQQQQPMGSSGSSVVDSSQGAGVGSSSPLTGTGGNSQWTNIQNYLQANAGNTNSSKFLSDNANKVLDSENKSLSDQATGATQQAQSQVDSENIGQDAASKLISDASNAGQGSDTYNQNVGQLRNATTAQYKDPSFNYGKSADYQTLANGVNDNTQFQQYMDQLYNQNAGGQMSQGQMSLQHQLDLDPTAAAAIQGARTSAQGRVNDFESQLPTTLQNTSNTLSQDKNQFGQYQQQLNSYLNNTGQTDQSNLAGLVGQWNAAEQNIKSGNVPTAQHDTLGFVYGGTPNGVAGNSKLVLDQNNFDKYTPAGTADLSNVTGDGANDWRNQFNTISDVLGNPQLAQEQAVQHGTNNFDQAAYQNELANWAARQQANGYVNQVTNGLNGYGGLNPKQYQDWLNGQPDAGTMAPVSQPTQPILGTFNSGGTF